jgi:peptide/nickel transport system permease protein
VPSYILRRIAYAFFTLLGVVSILFFLLHLTGDPASLYVPARASPAQVALFRQAHGFNDPLPLQYVRFIGDALHGDFGTSLTFGRPALPLALGALPATLALAGVAILFAVVIGVPAGIIAAVRKGRATDTAVMTGALFGLSVPPFWLGLMLILLVGVHLKWLPVSGAGGVDHLILPALTIAAAMGGALARLLRSNLLEALNQDYVRTAQAMGLRHRSVVMRHALKNAMLPLITVFGLQVGLIITGVFVVEVVFAYPGMGQLTINAIEQRDFPLVEACVLVAGLGYVVLNLIVDITYKYLDPRIRLTSGSRRKR